MWSTEQDQLKDDGFVVIPDFFPASVVAHLGRALEPHIEDAVEAGVRGIVDKSSQVRAVACSRAVRGLVEEMLGPDARLVRSVVFNKTAAVNWLVTWHQDLSIAVERKAQVPGFAGWSVKAGVCHVQPPVELLQDMLTFRVHLDDADERNGALVVSPGTHRLGRIPASEVAGVAAERSEHVCKVAAGDVLLFKPLLAHCSKKAVVPGARRVLHLEFCAQGLPSPLQWATAA